jgi:hypothetical protein
VLARNPQDLALLAEVVKALGTARVPAHRAELYREILNQDGALKPWVESGDPLLAVLYALAFRMVAERRVLQDGQLREWIAGAPAIEEDAVTKIVNVMQASRLFRRETERDVLGREQPVTGFRHELIGKFLAARHVRRMIEQDTAGPAIDYIKLSGDELWLDVFYFVIDEIHSPPVLNRVLRELLSAGGPPRIRIAAYAIGTKRAELGNEVLASYEKAKLNEDLAQTPAPEQHEALVFQLTQGLRASSPHDRMKAAQEIEKLGKTAAAAMPALRKALKDPSWHVRNAVASALAAIGTPEAQRALQEFEAR